MAFSVSDIKKLCKEKGYGYHAGSLFGITKNDSGKCDLIVETPAATYAVKVITVGDAEHVYFCNVGGYISVKGKETADYMWVEPKFPADAVRVLLLDAEIPSTELSKNAATTVTAGANVFGCKVYTPSAFVRLLG